MADAGNLQLGRILRSTALLLAVCSMPMMLAVKAWGQAGEYQVKAAYLYQFLNFVFWPDSAFTAADSPYEICVLGRDPFAGDLENSVRGKQVRGRPVRVQRLSTASSARRCHILFIADSERTRLGLILEAVRGLPLLTVSELRDFELQGGMVRFVMEHDMVRLRINPDASGAAGVAISSKLLAVATVVRGGGGV